MLASLLSGARSRVLAALFVDPDRERYLREIARAAGVPLRAVQRELALYLRIGLIRRRPRGREVFIAVDRTHPLFAGLRALLVGTGAMSGSVTTGMAHARSRARLAAAEVGGLNSRRGIHSEDPADPNEQDAPQSVPESVREAVVAVVGGDASASERGRRRPAAGAPAADESWRVW